MTRLAAIAVALVLASGCHRQAAAPAGEQAAPMSTANPSAIVYMCPMDKDIRKLEPGTCPRCGKTLVTSVPDPVEYHLQVDTKAPPVAGQVTHLTFHVTDPWKNNPVTRFSLVHERLYHAFVVGSDLDAERRQSQREAGAAQVRPEAEGGAHGRPSSSWWVAADADRAS